jgi:uncharacterized protein YukE
MCKENCEYVIILLVGLLLASVADVLHGEEPGQWYLISETELRSIEEYKNKSEAEKHAWLLQAQELRAQAYSLRGESQTLNNQLSRAREQNRELQKSFNEYAAEQLTLISSKHGEIVDLKQAVADKTLEAETNSGKAALRLVIIISLLTARAGYSAFKVLRFLRVIPL